MSITVMTAQNVKIGRTRRNAWTVWMVFDAGYAKVGDTKQIANCKDGANTTKKRMKWTSS